MHQGQGLAQRHPQPLLDYRAWHQPPAPTQRPRLQPRHRPPHPQSTLTPPPGSIAPQAEAEQLKAAKENAERDRENYRRQMGDMQTQINKMQGDISAAQDEVVAARQALEEAKAAAHGDRHAPWAPSEERDKLSPELAAVLRKVAINNEVMVAVSNINYAQPGGMLRWVLPGCRCGRGGVAADCWLRGSGPCPLVGGRVRVSSGTVLLRGATWQVLLGRRSRQWRGRRMRRRQRRQQQQERQQLG